MGQTTDQTQRNTPTGNGAHDAPLIDPLGSVRITKHVLASIIEHAALGVEGVAKMAPVSSPWPRILTRVQPRNGLAVSIHHHIVAADLYLILKPGANMVQTAHAVQDAVIRAIEEMLGMTAGDINIYIQDVA